MKKSSKIEFTMLGEIRREISNFLERMKGVESYLEFVVIMHHHYNIDILSRKTSVDSLIKSTVRNLYLFFYNDKLRVQRPRIFFKHIDVLVQLSKSPPNKCVIVNTDLHPQHNSEPEMKIKLIALSQARALCIIKLKSSHLYSCNRYTKYWSVMSKHFRIQSSFSDVSNQVTKKCAQDSF